MTGASHHISGGRFDDAIRAALGGAPDTIEPSRLHRFSTGPKRGDMSGWCRLFGDGRAGVGGCWRLGVSLVWTAADRDGMTPGERAALALEVRQAQAERRRAESEQWRRAGSRIASLWSQCRPVRPGDPVHRYLAQRLALPGYAPPPVLRYHPAMPYVHDGETVGTWPAMVAPMVGVDGRTIALHRTYLEPSGAKADVPGPGKKLTPACGPLTGASIPLGGPDTSGNLGVAEGIETALAAARASGIPTVAAYSAGALAGYQCPAVVRRLVIFADHDSAGRDAAAALRARAMRSGLAVTVMTPTEAGADWCDVWARRDAVALDVEGDS